MTKAIDKTTASFAAFTLFFIWYYYLFKTFWGALFLGALTAFTLLIILNKVLEKRTARYPKEKFYATLALMGNKYVLELYASLTAHIPNVKGSYYLSKTEVVFSAYRFSAATADDIAAAYRAGLDNNANSIIFICKKASREVIALAYSLPCAFTFVTAPELYKKTKSQNLLPSPFEFKKPEIKLPPLRRVLDTALSENNVRYYAFTGAILALMVFITPLKLYYVIMSSISLLLALACKLYSFYDK